MSFQTKLLTKFENLPYFTKKDLAATFAEFAESESKSASSPALNRRITRLLKDYKLLQLKKGLYTTSKFYFTEPNKTKFTEFISTVLCTPSYLSLEYVLKKHNLLAADPTNPITCITTKTTRSFKNPLGNFRYSNIKPLLFCGFEKTHLDNHEYYISTKAKALFDYLYLKPNIKSGAKRLHRQLFEDFGIIWNNFSKQDFEEFDKYVWKSNSKKMMDIWHIINNFFASKDFDRQIKELLAE